MQPPRKLPQFEVQIWSEGRGEWVTLSGSDELMSSIEAFRDTPAPARLITVLEEK